jgi:hypothetical protein
MAKDALALAAVQRIAAALLHRRCVQTTESGRWQSCCLFFVQTGSAEDISWPLRHGAPKSSPFSNHLFTESPQTQLFQNWQEMLNYRQVKIKEKRHIGLWNSP